MKSLLIERRQLEEDLEVIDKAIKHLSTTDKQTQLLERLDHRSNISMCRVEVESCRKKYAAATKTVAFMKAADCVTQLIDAVAENSLDRLRESVRAATNQKLERLIKGEPLRVARIGSALELSSEGVSLKGGVSEGQSLSVAYAFITSLLEAAPYKLPFIVDSPAVSLDNRVRREVGDVIPELFDQMIMFVISSEKAGFHPADGMRKRCACWPIDASAEIKHCAAFACSIGHPPVGETRMRTNRLINRHSVYVNYSRSRGKIIRSGDATIIG
ncbi:hypothetical protein [Erythrobacter sp.]|uniref:hypothetical protein n=1 Tax=Erythrobacter sp. TaxID=1042 RepID=UPI0025F27AAC|nr:hypothetical protein [Erythrobacter sp.]